MRCFYVLVHGRLTWARAHPKGHDGGPRAGGFYCDRYVLPTAAEEATEKAFRRVRDNLDKRTGWLRDGTALLTLEAEEVAVAPVHKLLKPDNRGHTFYAED